MKVVLNVHAGDGPEGDDRVQQLQQALKAHALDAQVEIPNDGESLTECAERLLHAGAQTLVAAGGDGTIAALAGPCHAAGAVLGVIPMGTFNYFARAHGIPEALDDAVKTLAHTSSRPVTLGRVNDRIFLNNASIGLYPHHSACARGRLCTLRSVEVCSLLVGSENAWAATAVDAPGHYPGWCRSPDVHTSRLCGGQCVST